MKIALIDFDDSFTANISEIISRLGHKVNTVNWRNLNSEYINSQFNAVVLGPGPGHFLEYKETFSEIEKLRSFPVLGICLGHQIILHLEGAQCKPMQRPMHGKSLNFKNSGEFLNISDFRAQLYNSWCIFPEDTQFLENEVGRSLIFDNEFLAIYHNKNWISCQFHPESVGTSYPCDAFESLLKKICIMI